MSLVSESIATPPWPNLARAFALGVTSQMVGNVEATESPAPPAFIIIL